MDSYPVSKIEIAQQQLEGAIWLLFWQQNFVSSLSLTMSAHEVIADLLRHAGQGTCYAKVKERYNHKGLEQLELIRKKIRFDWAKLKHADREPLGMEDFSPEIVPLLLTFAIQDFYTLTSVIPHLFQRFFGWVYVSYPDIFGDLLAKLPAHVAEFSDDFSQKSLVDRLQLGAEAVTDFCKS